LNWHHVAIVARNGDVDPSFYLDGVLQPVTFRLGASTINLYPSTEPLHIGAQVDPLSGWLYYSKTLVDELSIYSRALTGVEIQAIYNAGSSGKCAGPTAPCAPLSAGLVSWWQAESNALDHVGGNNGTLFNGVGYAAGMVGEAFVFNGTNSYVEVPDSASLRLTNELTIECWVKLLDLQAENYLVNKGGDWTRGALDYGMTITQPLWNNVLGFAFANGSRHSVSITDLNWHHVAVTARNGDADPTFYVDGVQQPVTLRDGADTIYLYPSTEPLRIGAQVDPLSGWFFYSKAVVDELSIYSRMLTAAEVQAIYNAGSSGKCAAPAAPCAPLSAGLVSWWRGETNALDAVGGNNGTLTNGASFALGMVGQAFSFNGSSNSYVEVPDSPTLRFTNALTIECWAKRLNTSEVHVFLEKGGDWTGGQTDFEMALNDTYYAGSHFGFAFAGGWRGCAVTPDTAWHHYAAVAVSGQADPLLYIDGVPQAITYRGGPGTMILSATTRPLHIGAQLDAQTGWFYYSSTLIDELAVYNRALAAAEIQAIYNAGSGGKCASATAPVILQQPASQTANVGANASFSVLAAGTPPLSYQWQFNGTNLTAATASSLSLATVQVSDEGSYSVLVSNSAGTVLSSNAILTVSAPPCAPLPSGLIGWWKGDGNGMDSAGTNNAYALLNVSFTNGIVGQAFACDPESYPDGTYNGIQIADQPAYALTNSLSIETWIRPRGDGYNIFWRGDNRPGLDPYELGMQGNNTVAFLITDANGNSASVSAPLVYNQWWYVAGTLDGASGKMSLYTNGILAGQITTTVRPFGALVPQDSPGIGIGNVNDGFNNFPFTGDIDEVSLYNRALTAAEIQAIYTAAASGKCTGTTPPAILVQPISQGVTSGDNVSFSVLATGTQPLSYQWMWNGTTLATATASSLGLTNVQPAGAGSYSVVVSNSVGTALSSNAILTVNPPSCTPPPAGLVSWWRAESNALDLTGLANGTPVGGLSYVPGKVEQAFSFNGTDAEVRLGTSAGNFGTNDFSIEFWIQTSSARGLESVLGKRPACDGDSTGFWDMRIYNGSLQIALMAPGVTDYNQISATRLVNDGVFHHVAFVRQGTNGTLYIDGTFEASGSTPGVTYLNTSGDLVIGRSACVGVDGTQYFTGQLDEITVYQQALSLSQVQAIYSAGSAGKCVPPMPPSILVQPASQIAMSGNNVSFSVLADGTQPLSYQWMLDGTNLAAATASSLGLTNVQLSDAGSYLVLVSNIVGTVLSSNAVLTVFVPPPCAAEPGGLVDWWRAQGNALDFVGTNQGTLVGGVTYTQGEVGQTFVFDGNGSYIDFGTNVGNFGTGDFTVEFWLSTTSTRYEALLSKRNICDADNLFNILIQSGELLFEVDGGASSYGFFGFQDTRTVNDGGFHHAALVRQGPTLSIYVDGALSSSGTLSSGQVANVSSAAHFYAGTSPCVGVDGTSSYTGALDEISLYGRALTPVEIQSLYAAGRSGKCTVPTGPVVLVSPTNLTVIAESNAVFGVVAEGSAPLAYQWRFNSAELAGQTNPTLLLTAVGAGQAGSYDVVVTNAMGAVTSAVAVLTVYVPPPPGFTLQPQGQTVPAGTNVTLTAAATNAWPISYQWYLGGTPLGGATSSALNLTDVQATNGGDYAVVAANAWNAATSTVATLTVVPSAPFLTLQPQSAGVFSGFQAQLSVAAAGTEPLAYQWQWYGTNIPGATSASYVVSNMVPAEAGPYQVTVSNSVGTAPSAQALLVMVPVACWGSTPIGLMSLPVAVTNAVAVSAGSLHNLALRRDGAVVAWGAANQISVPAGLANAVAVSAGGDHSLALKADGSVVARGANNAGQTTVPANLSNVVAVAAGGSHSLALKANGTVVGWGLNTSGQTSVPGLLTNVVAISAGSNHSIALRGDGTVFAWGSNASGQTNVPSSLADVVAIAAGASHNLALRSDGTVAAWGSSTYGQTNVPAGLTGVVAIGAGAFHSLAVKSDGTLVAWGAGTSSMPSTFPNLGQSYIPPTVTNMVAASGGQAHTLALAGDGPPFITAQPVSRASYSGRRVVFRAAASGALPLSYQWQYNGNELAGATSQLLVITSATNGGSYRVVVTNLLGSATSATATLSVMDSAPFVTVQPVGQPAYLGVQELLQVTADGSGPLFYQWRLNGTNIAGATSSSFLLNHLQVSDAGSYSVVVSNAFGAVSSTKVAVPIIQTVAWGAGTNYGAAPSSGQSMVPAGLNNAVAVAGGGYHSLALKADTKVLAWGAGATNTGIAPNYGQSIVPGGLSGVAGIAGGLYHSLAVTANGSVTAWGAGTITTPIVYYGPNYGQCIVPASASNVIAVAASDYDSFALRSDGKVVGWGESIYSITNIPATVTNVVAIAARGSHVLAMRSDGTMVQWGNQSSLPPTPYNYVAIAAGVNHCLALRSDGTVVSWGGQYAVPSGLANVVDIAAGYDHSVALRSDGTVVTWGATNTYGRNLIPPGLTNVVGIGCGYYNSLAVLGDGTPLIKLQPANRVALIATSTNFVAMAVGAQPLHFQWQFNGTNLVGSTSSSFTLANVQAPSAGSYRVVVTNVFGAVTSSVATLATLVPLGQALNASSLVWSTSGNAAWFGEAAVTHDGVSAAQSGPITDSQTSTLQTTVVGAGTGTFWWKVSSEQWFDYLSFYIDGVMQASISGDTGWQQQAFAVANGSHTLKWTYAKDPSVSAGADAGWLDQVTFVPNPPVITLQPLSQHGSMGSALRLSVAATGAPPLSYQWLKNGTNLTGGTSAALTIACATRRDSGVYEVAVSNPGGSTPSSNATLVVRSPQRMGPPLRLPGGGIALTSGDADAGALLASDLPNFQVQASTNLVDWVALLNALTVTNGMLYLVDPDSANYPYRFYRIIELDDAACVTNPPVITAQPLGQTVSMGAGVTLGVTAYGAPRLNYQWVKDGTNVVGATAATLVIPAASRHHAGVYVAVVSNPVGQSPSSNAVLVVRVPEKLGCPTVLADGTFALLAGDADGGGLQPGDLPGFQAQASSNLVNWVTLTNCLTLTNGMLRLCDPASTNCPSRFYRIIEQ
jgi:alpha-tubulin suppressor-like RCC1 family protein